MPTKHRRNFIIVILLIAMVATAALIGRQRARAALPPGKNRMAGLPNIILWAWERPSDLSFIDPHEIGVAYLASTIYLRGNGVIARPRRQTLIVPPGTRLLATTRIEIDRLTPPALTAEQRAETVAAIRGLALRPNISAIQIDFDATISERTFYHQLIEDLRPQLPANMPLSITSLASWCIYDNWLNDLPVDEAVPMLFRLGPARREVLQHLEAGKDFRAPLCQCSLGISTDEPMPWLPGGRRVYIFSDQSWSPATLDNIVKKVKNGNQK